MKKLTIALLATLISVCAQAYTVKLHAVDTDDEPEIYASCRIYTIADSTHAVVAGLTDSIGNYTAELPEAGTYRLRIEAAGTGYSTRRTFSVSDDEPAADLGTIILGGENENLEELTVTAQKPLVVKQIDRIGYDVQADPESKVLNLQDMLRRVPMVAVDADGSITVNGSSNFVIYKNGRPNNALSKNAKDILSAIPASMIKSVEVITEPGARYDAEGIGAILNIVTIDNAEINGVTGTASAEISSRDWMPRGSLFLTAQVHKVTFSLQGGVQGMNRRSSKNENYTEILYPDNSKRATTQTGHNSGAVGWFGGEASWEIDKHNLVTGDFNGFIYNVKPKGTTSSFTYGADGAVLSSFKGAYNYPSYNFFDIDGSVNYEHSTSRKGETLTASYMVSSNAQHNREYTEYSDITGNAIPYTSTTNHYNLDFIEHTFQLDWKRPFGEVHTLETGGKYIMRRNHSTNNAEYTGWQNINTEFKHITDVGAIYAQYTARVKKVTLRAGIRYEYSHLKGSYPDGSHSPFSSNLHDFVPSASASWQINDANSLAFNFATRINRPGIDYLNPAETYSPSTVSHGEPTLESAYSRSMKLTYMLIKRNFNVSFSANYSFNNDNISSIQYYDPSIDLIVNTYGNVGHIRNLSFSGFAQWTITPKTRFMFNGSVSRDSYRQEGYSLARWGFHGFARLSQTLPWKLNIEGSIFYMGKRAWDVYSYSGSSSPFWSISLRRSFLKEDRLTVSLTAQNPIGPSTRNWKSYTVNGNYTGFSNNKMFNFKSVSLSISYRFGNLNAQVRKTAASISNDDVVGGASAGGSQGSQNSASQPN